MVLSIGIDIVPIERIFALWSRHRNRLCESVITPNEFIASGLNASDSGNPVETELTLRQAQYLAERIAGKEATIKVLGVGASTPYELNDIEINGSLRLEVRIKGALNAMAADKGIDRMTGSCSSTKHTTVAIIIGESQHA